MRIAAFNVRVGENASPEAIGHALKPYDLDIVCFSEAPAGRWTERAAAVLRLEHTVVGEYTTAGHDDKYKTIASRTPLYAAEEVLMADTLHTATRAMTDVAGQPIAVYSIHFPFGWRDQAHIDETTGKVTAFVEYLKARPENEVPIVAGDFNFLLSSEDTVSPYHEMFRGIGMEASWRDLGTDLSDRCSCGLFKPAVERAGYVIDHIVYRPSQIRAIEGDIIELPEPMSDHNPVWAHLALK